MADNNDDHKEQRIGLWVAGGAAALAVLSVLFYSVYGWESGKIEGSPKYGQAASETVQVAAASEVAASEVVVDTPAPAAASASSPAEQVLTETPAATAPATAADSANAVVENGVVKFYFATGKADLAPNAEEALKDVLTGVKEGKKAVISGYNDSTGNVAINEQLSKQRAFAVRNALLGFGVPESQIELRKPENTEAGQGNDAEARRVEVILE
ncbi:OmpA family protein [Neisseria sp. 83E34]|uniref:OmpA family protein n=1 Tax=Neisseria sp. 83E34 TaxID=1692264 RepID=UPI0006CEA971|nr:OmpA family protein [Neisseria sp. 83E34]KPN71988.1 cytochrome C oxidase subunit II [Neisseria sp. 83E34]